MHLHPRWAPALGLLLCLGCGVGVPQVTYAKQDHPLRDTAVLISSSKSNVLCQIVQVNGNPTSSWQSGHPTWVRVLPGPNRFDIRCENFDLGGGAPRRWVRWLHLPIPDMKPKHVYRVVYDFTGEEVKASVEDLGEGDRVRVPKGLVSRYEDAFISFQ